MSKPSPQPRGEDIFGWWMQQNRRSTHTRIRRQARDGGASRGIRFAFYGRISTEDWQDRFSSGQWQLDFAEEFVSGRGVIVAKFFDVGYSRARAWTSRPQAAALLAALSDPGRGWDAIVVGEFERAFYGDQLQKLMPVFAAFGVQVWLPELDGPVDLSNELHLSLLRLLGVHSRREVQRARFRAKAAMRAQVEGQGRDQGGRAPYGYCRVDAGPHPNKAQAKWGRRARRFEPDPATAEHVRWIFAQRLTGRSIKGIARELNERGVPCPSKADPESNPHRSGQGWVFSTVQSILTNPRYTGRQVWNRQQTELGPLDQADDVLGRAETRRWNTLQEWVVSAPVAHPALVSDADFVAVQAVYTTPEPVDGQIRDYMLAGLMFCRVCQRRMVSHWVHDRESYRCLHGRTSAHIRRKDRQRTVYARQDEVFLFLATHVPQLRGLYDGHLSDLTTARQVLDAFQRERELAVRCDNYAWRVEIDDDLAFDGFPVHLPRKKTARQPRTARTPPEQSSGAYAFGVQLLCPRGYMNPKYMITMASELLLA